MVSTAMKIVKYLLFVFNFIFWVTGIAIITIGAIIISNSSKYIGFLDDNVSESIPIVLIVVGGIVTFIAFFGCCGAIRESYCMMMTFSILLVIIFILELAIAITAYVQKGKLDEKSIRESLKRSLEDYDPANVEKSKIWNTVQHESHCCGITNYKDWSENKKLGPNNLPDSCCKEDIPKCGEGAMTKTDLIYTDGCFEKAYGYLKRDAVIVAGVCLGIAFIEIVGIVFACMLARAIKREYEIV